MLKFKFPKESIVRFVQLTSSSKEIAAATNPVFILTDSQLKTRMASKARCMSYDVDVTDVEGLDDLEAGHTAHFSYLPLELVANLQRVSNQGLNDLEVTVNTSTNRLTLENTETNTTVSLAITVAQLDEAEVQTSDNMLETMKANSFSDATSKINVNADMVQFFDLCMKATTLSSEKRRDFNTIVITDNCMNFHTNSIIIKKNLPDGATDGGQYCLQSRLVEFLKPFMKDTKEGIPVVFDADFQKALIESDEIGFKAVLALDENIYGLYPEDALASITPKADNNTTVDITVAELKQAISLFTGTFANDEWGKKFSPIDITSTADGISQKYFKMFYSGSRADCETSVYITEGSTTGECSTDTVKFRINCNMLNAVLPLVDKESIQFVYSNYDMGVVLRTDTVRIIISKSKI